MSFDFSELDQRFFGWLWRLGKRAVAKPPRPGAVTFEEVEPSLAMLATVIAGRRVDVRATDDRGGSAGDVLRVPSRMTWFDDTTENRDAYTLRVAIDAGLAATGIVCGPSVGDDASRMAAMLSVPFVLDSLAEELPGIERIRQRLLPRAAAAIAEGATKTPADQAWRAVHLLALDPTSPARAPLTEDDRLALVGTPRDIAVAAAFRVARRLVSGGSGGSAPSPNTMLPLVGAWPRAALPTKLSAQGQTPTGGGGTERAAPRRDSVRRIELPERDAGENPVVHSFEKVHTAERYQGGRKNVDGEDELALHEEALADLDLQEVVRTNERAKSTYSMDITADAGALSDEEPPASSEAIDYDEWDGTKYRPRFCRVFVEPPALVGIGGTGPRVSRQQVARVRAVFEALDDVRRARPRSPRGGEVDVDALVQRYASVRAGHEGDDRLYIERKTVEHDVATLILLDTSSSSDGYVRGQHVLALEREAAACVGDALDRLNAPFAVAGFYSNTRRDCRYVDVKGFDARWSGARARLSAIQPAGYTRIGPAIRHATKQLAGVPARRRALLIITDGRPTDYDRYEGKYGVDDVQKAVAEAKLLGVDTFALCIADAYRPHLRAMFGVGGYEILSRPEQLASRLGTAQAHFRR